MVRSLVKRTNSSSSDDIRQHAGKRLDDLFIFADQQDFVVDMLFQEPGEPRHAFIEFPAVRIIRDEESVLLNVRGMVRSLSAAA